MNSISIKQNLYNFRAKFLTKFMFDGKKYSSFFILNKIFYFLNLENKNNFKIFNYFFLIIEPLFYIEKSVLMNTTTQKICFLTFRKKINLILTILADSIKKLSKTKSICLSNLLYTEIYMSLFKKSQSYSTYLSQNESFLKLKNNTHYRWF